MLPVTPTSTVLPQNKQCKLHVAKDHGKLQKGMEENMRRYAIYYVYAAIETLPSKLGHFDKLPCFSFTMFRFM